MSQRYWVTNIQIEVCAYVAVTGKFTEVYAILNIKRLTIDQWEIRVKEYGYKNPN